MELLSIIKLTSLLFIAIVGCVFLFSYLAYRFKQKQKVKTKNSSHKARRTRIDESQLISKLVNDDQIHNAVLRIAEPVAVAVNAYKPFVERFKIINNNSRNVSARNKYEQERPVYFPDGVALQNSLRSTNINLRYADGNERLFKLSYTH